MAISIEEFPDLDLKAVVSSLLDAAGERVAAAAVIPASTLEDHELSRALAAAATVEAQASAVKLALLAEADRRETAAREGQADTPAWAARLTGSNRAVMAGGLRLARLLETRYETTRRAFAVGRINEHQMRVIVNAAEKIPTGVTEAQRAEAEAALVTKAEAGMPPERLRHAGRRMLEVINRELADKCEADQLTDEETRADTQAWFSMHDNGDGTVVGKFQIPELSAAFLRAALERLSAPRRFGRNQAGDPVADPTVPGETLPYTERLGQAFCELLEHLPTDRLGPLGATLLVTVDFQRLLDQLAAGHLDTGITIGPHNVRRLACNAGILPAVLDGSSEPLDVGRAKRLHTPAMRRALALSYDSCAAEGCTRPYAWCEMHHPHPWSAGGDTSVHNAVPLCGWHHHRAHDPTYRVTYLESGEVRFRHKPVQPWRQTDASAA